MTKEMLVEALIHIERVLASARLHGCKPTKRSLLDIEAVCRVFIAAVKRSKEG